MYNVMVDNNEIDSFELFEHIYGNYAIIYIH